ncbi:MAG: phenylalanine--tRNA ligase subunit beta [Candidatus Diapherotrites archaeon]|nr:phenylalanine--tRNA ligase subunit beta [Candidatus Diapherotrites archaeon]
MPTIEISKKDLEKLLGKKLSEEELKEKAALFVKGEIEAIENDTIKIELKDTTRPDLWSVEGIARELAGLYGIQKGLPKFKVYKSNVCVQVDPKLEGIRPKGAYAIAKGIKVTEYLLEQLIQLQEKLCETFGRKRREVAIGIFDYDKVEGNLRYYAAKPETEFVPLGFSKKMSLKEILAKHPKGIEYGRLLEGKHLYPLLVDSNNEVLSMPPIINSEYSGKVTTETKNLFVDVTGFDQELINMALEIVCAALHDRGARIESVTVNYGKEKIVTPEFKARKIIVPVKLIERTIGESITASKLKRFIEMKRMNCILKKNFIVAEYPSYRADVLHAIDIVEDILIAMDYNSITPEAVRLPCIGSELAERKICNAVREVCIGMQLQEVLTFTLTSKEKQQAKMLLPEQEFVELENPLSSEYAVFRKSIVPELLDFLAKNKHCEYPQKIFEVGKAVHLNEKKETKVEERNVVCIALSGKDASFNEIKAHLDALCKALSWRYEIKRAEHPSFKSGFCAMIKIGEKLGMIGEINENVLKNFGLKMPVAVLEVEL